MSGSTERQPVNWAAALRRLADPRCRDCVGIGLLTCVDCDGSGSRSGHPVLDEFWYPCVACQGSATVLCACLPPPSDPAWQEDTET